MCASKSCMEKIKFDLQLCAVDGDILVFFVDNIQIFTRYFGGCKFEIFS